MLASVIVGFIVGACLTWVLCMGFFFFAPRVSPDHGGAVLGAVILSLGATVCWPLVLLGLCVWWCIHARQSRALF